MQWIFIKKCFLYMVGSVCPIQWFTTGLTDCHPGSKHFTDDDYDDELEKEVPKWLRQQSKDFYAMGFNALVSDGTSVSILIGCGCL
jgi:hypothetical protein